MAGETVSCMAVRWEDFQERPGATPVYVQLADFIAAAIERGDLGAGSKLPAERDLADLIGHSPETVAKARRLLVERGLVESHVGRGSYVTVPGEP
ncbi:GntR family transcriptional regulator [Trebonia kvetii]|uniref:GntR family transcriptional regulator n=1 Tax=Trebonia kvetii TaxID=2480626 RepID=A0A6P2BTU9_9ACTN|nr:GntR family transcriptional regulator [Trebonia kvetii]TVZ02117.1 GntR family transcriptional regulator [Trebonia kvetii]